MTVKHWRRGEEPREDGWYEVYWWRVESPGIRNCYIKVFGKELADSIVGHLNGLQVNFSRC